MGSLIFSTADGVEEVSEKFQELLQTTFATFSEVSKLPHIAVGLHFVGAGEMQRLNLEYREKDKPTDILSFTYGEEVSQLGDLALCLDVAEVQAAENGWTIETETMRLLAHGFAHLLGYDHETQGDEKEMIALEIKLLHACGLDDIYPQG